MQHAAQKCKGPGERATHMETLEQRLRQWQLQLLQVFLISLSFFSLSSSPLNLQQLPGAALKCCNLSLSHRRLSLSFSLSRRNTFSPTPSIILPVLQLQFLRNEKKQIFIAESAERHRKRIKGQDVKRESVNGHEAGCEGVNCVGCFSSPVFLSCCL